MSGDAERFINFSFKLKKATAWAEKGFEIASEQIRLSDRVNLNWKFDTDSQKTLRLLQKDKILVFNHDFTLSFDPAKGSVVSFIYKGRELLHGNICPEFWRVPTDNDEGGGNRSYANGWREAGIDKPEIIPVKMDAELLTPHQAKIRVQNRIKFKPGSMDYSAVYVVSSDGEIQIENSFSTGNELPPLARVGLRLVLPSAFHNLSWYGRGPFESYEDRKESAKVGIYWGQVADQHFHYVMPQENGNKTDVRWIHLTSNDGIGLLISGLPLLSINVQDYSLDALNRSKQTHQLERGENIYLQIDYKQMGLGGDDSWSPRVHPEYLLTGKKYEYKFRMKPVGHKEIFSGKNAGTRGK